MQARHNRLTARPRSGFTLVEMLVSLAVLVVAMAVVSTVFSVSTRTATTSAALGETQAALRALEEQIIDDLRGIDPSQSVLVIAGRVQAAALTPESLAGRQRYRVKLGDATVNGFNAYDPRFDQNAQSQTWSNAPRDQYSDPRADVIMFFSQRPTASKCPPTFAPLANPNFSNPRENFLATLARGTKVSPVQIVYGHAAVGTATRNPNGTWNFPAVDPVTTATDRRFIHIEETQAGPSTAVPLSQIPVQQWILARRQVLIDDNTSTGFPPPPTQRPPFFFGGTGTELPDANAGENGEFTRILRCWSGDRSVSGQDRFGGDVVTFPLRAYLDYLSPQTVEGRNLLSRSPYGNTGVQLFSGGPFTWQPVHFNDFVNGLMYPNWRGANLPVNNLHIATVLRDPPPDLQSNAGIQALRGCAWFQVEFLLPEDPRNAFDTPLSSQRGDMPRWVEVPNGETFCFLPDTAENREFLRTDSTQVDADPTNAIPDGNVISGSRLSSFARLNPPIGAGSTDTAANRRVRLWPYAIRITIRVFDERGKLADPLVRTIVHRFD